MGKLYGMYELYLNKVVLKMGKNEIYLTEVWGGLKGIMYAHCPACPGAPELVDTVIKSPFEDNSSEKARFW